MKREWSLIKEVLQRIARPELGHHFAQQTLAEHCPRSVKEHLRFMHNVGLIERSSDEMGKHQSAVVALNLTVTGRDLLSAISGSNARRYSPLNHHVTFTPGSLQQTA
ncbi:DUF2513 domain-containing protein [Pseudomonas sp. EA_35y_Pfl2_R111]|uniref:DUF2513 domain-containing protein n=1 Tax=Pseudomonas sp. EA_35y_Pfl2_R111 TaxID=3088689 RepID=UPI0030DC17EB